MPKNLIIWHEICKYSFKSLKKGVYMTKTQLEKKAVELEDMNEHLISELIYVDKLMKDIGFVHGLISLKATAQKINKNK
jgi:hypothetical protein